MKVSVFGLKNATRNEHEVCRCLASSPHSNVQNHKTQRTEHNMSNTNDVMVETDGPIVKWRNDT